jgi:UPF0755 protein
MGSKKKNKASGSRSILYIILSIVGILVFAALFKLYEDVLASNVNMQTQAPRYVYYSSRLSIDENFKRIEKSKVLKSADALRRLAKWLGYEEMIKPGRYELTEKTNNLNLLRMLVSGRQKAFDVTFKYAERKEDLAAFWSKYLDIDSTQLAMAITNSSYHDSLGLTASQAIGIFVPNTYNFYWSTTTEQLIVRMIGEYRKFWNEDRMKQAQALSLSQGEVITLASIVQKETHKTDEMPIIAGVYLNRIKKGMLLQADPTIIYAMNDRSIRRVAGAMLKVNSPYNTYLYKGLPPGPICIPHPKTIDAVLNMKQHNYLYFCAREDFSGYHNFATNFAQHQVNARNYQRALNIRGIK